MSLQDLISKVESMRYKCGPEFNTEIDKLLSLNNSIHQIQCTNLESKRNRRREFISKILQILPPDVLDLPISNLLLQSPTASNFDLSEQSSILRGQISKTAPKKSARKVKPVTKIMEFTFSKKKDRSKSRCRSKSKGKLRHKKKPKSAFTKRNEASGRKMDEEPLSNNY